MSNMNTNGGKSRKTNNEMIQYVKKHYSGLFHACKQLKRHEVQIEERRPKTEALALK